MTDEFVIKKNKWSINGTAISFYDNRAINKPVIIFIHAFPFNKEIWENQLIHFSNNFRVIGFDIRGFGNSRLGYKPLSVDLFVEDLKILLDKLHLSKVILCGLSLGGYISLQFYGKYKSYVEALVLCDTQCRADSKLEVSERYKTIDDIIENGVLYFSEHLIPRLLAEETIKNKPGLRIYLNEIINSSKKEALAFTILALSKRDDTCEILPQINVPVLVVAGEKDKITPVEEATYLHENISGSELKIIPGAGHLVNLENPDLFNHTLEFFLQEWHINKLSL